MKRADGLDTCEKICRGEVISTKDTENVANLELNPVCQSTYIQRKVLLLVTLE